MQNIGILFGDGLHLFGLTWRALSCFSKAPQSTNHVLEVGSDHWFPSVAITDVVGVHHHVMYASFPNDLVLLCE
jgi:hypothetical protein